VQHPAKIRPNSKHGTVFPQPSTINLQPFERLSALPRDIIRNNATQPGTVTWLNGYIVTITPTRTRLSALPPNRNPEPLRPARIEDGKNPPDSLIAPIQHPASRIQRPASRTRIRFKCQRAARTINVHASAMFQRRGGHPPRDEENSSALDSVKHILSVTLEREHWPLPPSGAWILAPRFIFCLPISPHSQ